MKNKTSFDIKLKYHNSLSRIFSPMVLDSIAINGKSAYFTEICTNSKLLTRIDRKLNFMDFLDKVYDFLFKNYRNEYVYKNVIANKILLGKHSLNTSQMLTEFRVGKCKADAVIINGTSTVYEIKSEMDSFKRLEKQLSAYLQVFDHINVITTAFQAKKLISDLPESVGILTVTNKNTISTLRKSLSNKENINRGTLFDSLRKNEYLQVLKKLNETIPDIPNTMIFKECKKLFMKFSPNELHDTSMNVLKKRNDSKELSELIKTAPNSLSAYIISNSNNKKILQALNSRFISTIEKIISPALEEQKCTTLTLEVSSSN